MTLAEAPVPIRAAPAINARLARPEFIHANIKAAVKPPRMRLPLSLFAKALRAYAMTVATIALNGAAAAPFEHTAPLLGLGGDGPAPRLAYLATAPLDRPAPVIRTALIVLHGIDRDAEAYFQTGAHAARRAGPQAEATTLIVVPRFLGRREARLEGLGEGVLVWRSRAWMEGGDSAGAIGHRATRIGAFVALDSLLVTFTDRTLFPSLARVVLVGHSAGAQFVQRYAAASDGEDALHAAGLAVSYVVANPSSYLYLDGRRPAPDGGQAEPQPDIVAACPGYDDWKYGLRNLPSYLLATGGAERARARYGNREVVYLLGERDDDPAHHHLDRDCAAMLQGLHRRARGEAFQQHLRAFYGPDIAQRHVAVPVRGEGHSAEGMLRSRAARRYLFGGASSDRR